MTSKEKYPYKPQDKELRLEEHLLETNPNQPSPLHREGEELARDISLTSLIALNMKMGLLTYEEVKRDQSKLRKEITTKQHLMSLSQYDYIEELTLNLPGHITTQGLLAISLMKTHSLTFSLISILFFYLPSLILTIILSQLDRYYNQFYAKKVYSPHQDFFLFYLAVSIIGVSHGVLGLLLNNALLLFHQRSYSNFNMLLMVGAALLNIPSNSFYTLVTIMLIWGVITIMKGEENLFKDKSTSEVATTAKIPFLGLPALVTFISLFIGLNILNEIYGKEYVDIYLMASWFRIGTFTTTGGQAIIPFVLAEFWDNIGTLELLKGYAFVSLLPGPMFNLAAFIGGVMHGVMSSLISVIFCALPGILLIMAILPYPEKIKNNSTLRNFLVGINLASIGFMFAAAFKLWKEISFHNPYVGAWFSTFNIIICFLMHYSLNIFVPLVLIIGGGIMMLYSLVFTQMYT